MAKVYCKFCGTPFQNVASLTNGRCQRHPDGPGAGRHELYEGGEKSEYTCKYCGLRARDIQTLTNTRCQRHPDGVNKGRHSPAL